MFYYYSIIGEVNYGKCKKNKSISAIDSYLINDYKVSHLVFSEVTNYLKNHANDTSLDLGNINNNIIL